MVQLLNRWKNARRAYYAHDYPYVDEVIAIVERYPPHMYRGFRTPLEAACFAVLVDLVKRLDERRRCTQELMPFDCRNPACARRKRAHLGLP